MIDFIREPEPSFFCPDCFTLLVLDEDFPDICVYRCGVCDKAYSTTDLNRAETYHKERLAPTLDVYSWIALALVFAGWPALLFLFIMFISWIF